MQANNVNVFSTSVIDVVGEGDVMIFRQSFPAIGSAARSLLCVSVCLFVYSVSPSLLRQGFVRGKEQRKISLVNI